MVSWWFWRLIGYEGILARATFLTLVANPMHEQLAQYRTIERRVCLLVCEWARGLYAHILLCSRRKTFYHHSQKTLNLQSSHFFVLAVLFLTLLINNIHCSWLNLDINITWRIGPSLAENHVQAIIRGCIRINGVWSTVHVPQIIFLVYLPSFSFRGKKVIILTPIKYLFICS